MRTPLRHLPIGAAAAVAAIAAHASVAAAAGGISYCRQTGKVGYSTQLPDESAAYQAAIDDCVARGGVPDCCANAVATTATGCVAFALGRETFAFGRGDNKNEAVGDAVIQCQVNAPGCSPVVHVCEQ